MQWRIRHTVVVLTYRPALGFRTPARRRARRTSLTAVESAALLALNNCFYSLSEWNDSFTTFYELLLLPQQINDTL